MAVIWVVEKRESGRSAIADLLIGDHAVRVFASADTFQKLLQISSREAPDCIVMDTSVLAGADAISRVKAAITEKIGKVPLCLIGEIPPDAAKADPGWALMNLTSLPDGIAFRRCLDFLVPDSQKRMRNGVLKYKELMLDAEKWVITNCPLNECVALTAKEGRLLRFFLERIGRCLSRTEIQQAVWPGVVVSPRSVDTHISRLRQRLEGTGVEIRSVYGGGYICR